MEERSFLPGLKNYISKHHYLSVFIFILLIKIFFWAYGYAVASFTPLLPEKYFVGYHHFGTEPRITGKGIDFFSLWIYADSEWYLSIAEHGYPEKSELTWYEITDETMGNLVNRFPDDKLEIIGKLKNTKFLKEVLFNALRESDFNTQEIAVILYYASEVRGKGKADPPYKFAPANPLANLYKYTEWDVNTRYAFFPLFPLVIAGFHQFLPLRIAAFTAANLLSILAFFMLYKIVFLYYEDRRLALCSVLFLIFYPFSVCYQAYYTEGLFLLLSISSLFFLKKKNIFLSVLCGFLLCLTKPMGVLIIIPLFVIMLRDDMENSERVVTKNTAKKSKKKNNRDDFFKKLKKIAWRKYFILFIVPFGVIPFILINYFNTGYWNYFSLILANWGYSNTSVISNLINNILLIGLNFFNLHLLYFHSSQIDYIIMIVFLFLHILSYKKLPTELWLYSFLLTWLVPVASKGDLMSFSRHMALAFPMFIYLAMIFRNRYIFFLSLSLFIVFNLLLLEKLINWYWVG